MLNFLRGTNPFVIFFIIFIMILLWVRSFIHPPTVVFLGDIISMPFYNWIIDVIPANGKLSVFITFSGVLSVGVILITLNNRYIIIQDRTYLPAFFFFLIVSSTTGLQRINPGVIASFFIIFIVSKMLKTYKKNMISYEFFDAGFFLSVGSLFYFPLIFYLPVIWAGLQIFRTINWREWLFPLLGLILPYGFLFAYYYLTGKNLSDFLLHLKLSLVSNGKTIIFSKLDLIFGIFLLLLVMISSYYMVNKYPTKKIHIRKIFLLFFWLFINTVLLYVMIPSVSVEIFTIAAIPVSYLFAHYFGVRKIRWDIQAMIIILLLFVLVKINFGHMT